jgi:hypothetical protein
MLLIFIDQFLIGYLYKLKYKQVKLNLSKLRFNVLTT